MFTEGWHSYHSILYYTGLYCISEVFCHLSSDIWAAARAAITSSKPSSIITPTRHCSPTHKLQHNILFSLMNTLLLFFTFPRYCLRNVWVVYSAGLIHFLIVPWRLIVLISMQWKNCHVCHSFIDPSCLTVISVVRCSNSLIFFPNCDVMMLLVTMLLRVSFYSTSNSSNPL